MFQSQRYQSAAADGERMVVVWTFWLTAGGVPDTGRVFSEMKWLP